MQQPYGDHTQPSVQFVPQQLHQVHPHMMMCPVQYVYEPQMLVPEEQVQSAPSQPYQNQAFLVQNPPPWIQNSGMVYMPQVQMTSNMQPYISQNMVQNPMFSYQYQPMIVQEHIRPMVPYMNQVVHTQQGMVQNPQVMVQNPQAMVQNTQTMVQNPQVVVQNSQAMSQNSEAMVQQSPQVMVQNSRTIVQNPPATVQNPQTGRNPQAMVPQTIVQNPQNMNTQSVSQKQVRIPIEQKRDLPILSQMLLSHTRKSATPELASPMQVIRTQYQNPRKMIIVNSVANQTCELEEPPPVSKEENDLPQYIKNQIPEGLSVKTIFKVPAAMVKPSEYVLQNTDSPSNACPRIISHQAIINYRDPQINYKRKVTDQYAKDENEVQNVKRIKQEANTQNSKVKMYINLPNTLVEGQGGKAMVAKDWRPPNTVFTQLDSPRKEDKLLRNTVYVQARGRVNETQNHQQGYVRIAPATSDSRTERNSFAQVSETNNRKQEDQIPVTENSSPNSNEAKSKKVVPNSVTENSTQNIEEVKSKKAVSKSFLTLSSLLEEAEETTSKNKSKSMPILLPDNVNCNMSKKKTKIASKLSNDYEAKGKAKTSKATHILSNINDNVIKKPKKILKEEKIRRVEKKMVTANDNMQPIEKYVLTHVLDGYIIQESNVPFVVQKSSLSPIKAIPNRVEVIAPSSSNNKENESLNNIEKVEKSSNNIVENEKPTNIEETGVTADKETEISTDIGTVKIRDQETETQILQATDIRTVKTDKQRETVTQLDIPTDKEIVKRDKEKEIVMQPDTSTINIKGTAEKDEERQPAKLRKPTNIKKIVKYDEERKMIVEPQTTKDIKLTVERDKEKKETEVPRNIKNSAKRDEDKETAVESTVDKPDIETTKAIDEDNPFQHLSRDTVKSWTVGDVFLHLMEYQGWRDPAQKLSEQEIDGESLLLVNKEQLLQIEIYEEHAELLCEFLEKMQ